MREQKGINHSTLAFEEGVLYPGRKKKCTNVNSHRWEQRRPEWQHILWRKN